MLELLLLVFILVARAGSPADITGCADMNLAQQDRLAALMAAHHPYDGCDGTIASCLAQDEPHPLARRLTGELCRRIKAHETDADIATALTLRERSMAPGGRLAVTNLDGVPMLGDPAAPVEVVLYACLRCPFCARLTTALMDQIEQGALRGRVRLYMKIFPLKGHPGSVEAGQAALASGDAYWDFVRLAYQRFDSFSVDALADWAGEVEGVDPAAWQAAYADPATRQRLVDYKREGMANGVNATPTLVIQGQLYQGELSVAQVVDVMLEVYERETGRAIPDVVPD